MPRIGMYFDPMGLVPLDDLSKAIQETGRQGPSIETEEGAAEVGRRLRAMGQKIRIVVGVHDQAPCWEVVADA